MTYSPGLHIIASLVSENNFLLMESAGVKQCIDSLVLQFELKKLGEVYHDFSSGGFTAVICLSESHISIHTWPEHNLVNLDIYLSNYQRNNDGTVKSIYDLLRNFFKSKALNEQIITR